MATVNDVRASLDSLESVRTRADSLSIQIRSLEEQVDRLNAELDTLRPAVVSAEQSFRSKAAQLDITKS